MEILNKIINKTINKTGLTPHQQKVVGIAFIVSAIIAILLFVYFKVVKKMLGHNPANMHTSQNEISIIKQTEGFESSAYQDSGGLWTIGYGSRTMPNGQPIQPNDTITEADATTLLLSKIASLENELANVVTVNLNQNQFDALIDFLYNTGEAHSALFDYVNKNDFQDAATFLRNHYISDSAGNYLKDLQDRRDREASQILS